MGNNPLKTVFSWRKSKEQHIDPQPRLGVSHFPPQRGVNTLVVLSPQSFTAERSPMNLPGTYSHLKAALDDSALASTEYQLHFAATLGKTPRWQLHSDGTAEFLTRTGHILTAHIHPIGVFHNKIWTWAWADTHITNRHTDAVLQVRDFGLQYNINILTRTSFNLGDWRTLITPNQLVTAPKIIHRIWRHFAFPMPDGSILYAALTTPNLDLPAPTTQGIAQTLRTTPNLVPVTKKRRALISYANIRSIVRQERRTSHTMRLHTGTGSVDVSWPHDEYVIATAPRTRPCDNDPHENQHTPTPPQRP